MQTHRERLVRSLAAFAIALLMIPATTGSLRAQDVFASPRAIFSPAPQYPQLAQAAGVRGVVSVQARVDAKGNVTEAKVVSGHEMLRKSAVDTVATWRFEPTMINGQAIPVVTTVNVSFGVTLAEPTATPAPPRTVTGPTPAVAPATSPTPPVPPPMPPRLNEIVATTDGDKEIGTLKWEIREEATGNILAKGDGPVRLKDIRIQDMSAMTLSVTGRRQTPKRIALANGFVLEMAEFPVPNLTDKSGFGLTARKTDISSFSWEWFSVSDSRRAVKLQEGGELGIELKQVGTDWEITRTDFNTDVSLRVIRMGVDPPGGPPYWRINISKGSTITWPSAVNGKVVPN